MNKKNLYVDKWTDIKPISDKHFCRFLLLYLPTCNILEVKQLTLMHVRSAGIFVTNRNTLMTSQHVINKNNF